MFEVGGGDYNFLLSERDMDLERSIYHEHITHQGIPSEPSCEAWQVAWGLALRFRNWEDSGSASSPPLVSFSHFPFVFSLCLSQALHVGEAYYAASCPVNLWLMTVIKLCSI